MITTRTRYTFVRTAMVLRRFNKDDTTGEWNNGEGECFLPSITGRKTLKFINEQI